MQSKKSGAKPVQRVIKKYPNRRLYDTETSTYITLAEVKQLVMDKAPFVVRDAKSGDDLTRSILLQIILEEEAGGAPMFTEQVLASIIRFYGQAMQGYMGPYLEKNIQAMTEVQAQLAEKAAGPDARDVAAVHDHAVADAAGPDGQLRRAVEERLPADAGADAEEHRAGAGRLWHQAPLERAAAADSWDNTGI